MSASSIPPNQIPSIRIAVATAYKAEKNLLFMASGGLGDQACAEPTVRFAINHFRDCRVSVHTEYPELFSHLGIPILPADSTDLTGLETKYLPLYLYPSGFVNNFMNANLMHGVDFSSISALRCQLPKASRLLQFAAKEPKDHIIRGIEDNQQYVVVHLGKTWPSRTPTGQWYQEVISELVEAEFRPVLIGKNCVPVVIGSECLDLRETTSLNDFIWICQNAWALVTNDSSPIHLAAPGLSKVAFVATCRNPSFLFHRDEMSAFFRRPMWQDFESPPNTLAEQNITEVPEGHEIEEYLPLPKHIVQWLEKLQ